MLLSALRSSCDRAKMKGTFGQYRREATEKSPIIQMVKELDGGLYEDIRTYGLRNGTLLAIAPTGTISLLMGSFPAAVNRFTKFLMNVPHTRWKK